jgi:hypothetical protein
MYVPYVDFKALCMSAPYVDFKDFCNFVLCVVIIVIFWPSPSINVEI